MSAARDDIIARIRASNERAGPVDAETAAKIRESLLRPGANLIPERAKGDTAALADRFVEMAEAALASVTRLARLDEAPGAVVEYLRRESLPPALVMAPDEWLDSIPWSDQPELSIRRGPAEPSDRVSLTSAFAGIAETGTLMVHSGPSTPNTLYFLPETHIVVLAGGRIVGAYEDAWARLRAHLREADAALPRAVTLITGPSRTGDIEKTIQIGVHGPRRLHIIVTGGEETRDST